MAPSTESSSTMMLSPKKTVTFAVNYQKSMVDQFWHTTVSPRSVKQNDESLVDLVQNSTAADINPTVVGTTGTTGSTTRPTRSTTRTDDVGLENSAPTMPLPPSTMDTNSSDAENTTMDVKESDEKDGDRSNATSEKSVTIKSTTGERQRRSTRELKKKEVPLERARVRYDMQQVPSVKRNRAFLDRFPLWMAPSTPPEDKVKAMRHRQQLILQEQQQQQLIAAQQQQEAAKQHKLIEDDKAALQPVEETSNKAVVETDVSVADANPPFAEDTSVVWVPTKRSEWEDSVLEMTAVCTSASLRRHLATGGRSSSTKPFHAPLSKEYIRDRVDIDDPLNGYQIRHKGGGWLQGFILWTNFTTWTHYFKWDSSHAMSGIPTMNSNSAARVDADGSLAIQLEQQPRSGDPFEGGVVHQGVAEISLVGGLGCGEYLLRMALDDIRKRKAYKFVVLQATDSSKAWYERFGFIRVGCVCKFLRDQPPDPAKPSARQDTPIMGYRHWTHPNESDSSLQKHGGPSYMMCLKLPEDDPNEPVETPFLDEMMKLQVQEKPTIEPIGGNGTPYPKLNARRGSMDSYFSTTSTESQQLRYGGKRKPSKGRRSASPSPTNSMPPSFTSIQTPPVLPVLRGSSFGNSPARSVPAGTKRAASNTTQAQSSSKRRRLSPVLESEQGNSDNHGTLSYNEKQYKNQWLAVSATEEGRANRRPPRDRSDITSGQTGTAAGVSLPPKTAEAKKKAKSNRSPANSDASLTETTNRPFTMKQKVKSYPRDRTHYYNKVVRPKNGSKSENYFVLHYDEPKGTVRIIPMEPRGVLSGKRAGRPRFQAKMENYNRDVRTVSCSDYDIVDAFMVMKTPVVASEAWDILDA